MRYFYDAIEIRSQYIKAVSAKNRERLIGMLFGEYLFDYSFKAFVF